MSVSPKKTVKNECSSVVTREKLLRVNGIFKGVGFSDAVSGTIEVFDIRTLRSIGRVFKGLFDDLGEYISYSYPEKPTVYICKNDGLIYAENNGPDEQKQAWHILRILASFGYVDNFKRIQNTSTKIKGWREK